MDIGRLIQPVVILALLLTSLMVMAPAAQAQVLEIVKTSDPVSGSDVQPGDVITYTITVTNDSGTAITDTVTDDLSAVLDDAFYNDDANATTGGVGVVDDVLEWTGTLAPDESAEITYSVTVAPFPGASITTITVMDTANVTHGDGWMVTEYDLDPGCPTLNGPEMPLPYEAIWGDIHGFFGPAIAPRTDQVLGGAGCYPGGWTGYDTAPNRWVLTRNFTAPGDGIASVLVQGFRGDGGARVRVNGIDAGLYGQWNNPAVDGTAQIPVTAGTNLIEIEVRDIAGPNMVQGHLELRMAIPPGDGVLENVVTGGSCPDPAITDPGDPGYNPDCHNVLYVREFRVEKTANPPDPAPGDMVTYTIAVTNTGEVDYTTLAPVSFVDNLSGVLDDASYNGDAAVNPVGAGVVDYLAPLLSWEGPLAAAETVTITYTVTINDSGQLGDGVLENTVTGGQCPDPVITDPQDPDFDAACLAVIPVADYRVVKTSDPDAGVAVTPGQAVLYTVTVTNTGGLDFTPGEPAAFIDDLSGVLDNATYNGDAVASDGDVAVSGDTLQWSGPLPVGDSVTVTYSVTVGTLTPGAGELINAVIGSSNCPAPAVTDPGDPDFNPDCSVRHPVLPLIACDSDPNLFNTGYDGAGGLLPPGAIDINWEVGDGTPAGPGSVSDWIPAFVVGQAAAGWTPSPFSNANWISFYPDAGHTVDVDKYYRYRFELDAGVDLDAFALGIDFYVDNSVWEVYVNGQPQSVVLPPGTLPQDPDDPYFYQGFTEGNQASMTLASGWQIGSNELIIHIKSAPALEGLLAQVTASPLCPGDWTVSKSVSTGGGHAQPGEVVTYTITVEHTGGDDLVGVSVEDDLTGVLGSAVYNNDEIATSGNVSYSEPVVTWTGDLAAGQTVTITYSVTVNDPLTSGAEVQVFSGTAQAWTTDSTWQDNVAGNSPVLAINAPDGEGVQLWFNQSNSLALDLANVVPAGETVVLHLAAHVNAVFQGDVLIESSTDGASYGNPVTVTPTDILPDFGEYDYTIPAGGARFIRITPQDNGQNGTAVRVDAVTYAYEFLQRADALNLVQQGSFEEFPECSIQDGAMGTWTAVDVHIWGNNCNRGWIVPDGVNSIDLDGAGTGDLQQVITGLTPGEVYNLTFFMAFNPAAGADSASMRLTIGDFDTIYTSASNATVGGFNRVHVTFTAQNASETLHFDSLTGSGDPNLLDGGGTPGFGVVFDDVRITPQSDLVDIGNAQLVNAVTGSLSCPSPAITDPDDPDFNPDCVTITPLAGIELFKTATPGQATPGTTVTYTFTAINTGSLPLTDVVISETDFSGTGTISALDCTPAQPAVLDPEDVLACTATYVVQQNDVDAGVLTNTAQVVGLDPNANAITDVAEAQVQTLMSPASVWECTADAIQTDYSGGTPPTGLRIIDLLSGEFETAFTTADYAVNAIGYNVLDDYVYGYTNNLGANNVIVRIGADGTIEDLGRPVGMPGAALNVGDVDDNGHYWLMPAAGGTWYQIDLDPTSLDYFTVIDSGTTGALNNQGWAWVPGTDGLWGVHNTNLWSFSRTTKSWTNHGGLGIGNLNRSVYADADGFLYTLRDNGQIFRIDIDTVTATLFAQGPTGDVHDGTLCSAAVIHSDYGDAPDAYGTLLASDGPRHSLRDYDPDTNTSSLMLGTNVSHETDGQPGADADADTFDDGLAAPIALVVGADTSAEVFVTNNTDEPATVAGWIDLNGNGAFDAGERDFTVVAAGFTGTVTLEFGAPTTVQDTYARFRVFPGEVADPLPTGPASAGEVEDYLVPGAIIDTPPVSFCTQEEILNTWRHWRFGIQAGIDFGTDLNSPAAVTGAGDSLEGTTVVSDTAGNLLFWANAGVIYNRNDQPMLNGTGLTGEPSATQTVSAFPAPGDPDKYFVVYTNSSHANTRLRYSVVDMTLDGGLGGVTEKNILLPDPAGSAYASESIQAIPNHDGTGFWALTTTYGSPNFIAFEFDLDGYTGNAVTTPLNPPNYGTAGYHRIQVSPDGTQLAFMSTAANSSRFRILDFDGATGQAYEQAFWQVDGVGHFYGMDWSPSGDYIYAATFTSAVGLYRWNVANNTTGEDIEASREQVGLAGLNTSGQVRRGPDGKMYWTVAAQTTALHVVHDPDNPGDPDFEQNAFALAAGTAARAGLPEFVTGCPPPVYSDWGDAPASYGTLAADGGAFHRIPGYDEDNNTAPLMLGVGISHENDGQPGVGADADDFDDGVADPIVLVTGEATTVEVTVTNDTDEDATLVGWIDLAGTGTFDAGDRSNLVTVPANSGLTTHELNFGPPASNGDTYARFRVFPGEVADPQPIGPAAAGEVEDYPVTGTEPEPFVCEDQRGYILFDNPTQVAGVDLVTGEWEILVNPLFAGQSNAWGYNVTDNMLWGYHLGQNRLVRVGADWQPEFFDIADLPVRQYNTGDVSADGVLYLYHGSGGTGPTVWIERVDVNPASATYLQRLDPVPLNPGRELSDWAFSPVDGMLYSKVGVNRNVLRIHPDTGAVTLAGTMTAGPNTHVGSIFMDAAGSMYLSANDDGGLWRVAAPHDDDVTVEFLATGPATGNNDGARCMNGPLNIDFGDAPDSYGTTLANDGARHGIPFYDEATNTAPLMLGTQLDPEFDGQPSPWADADNFDDGVADPIVVIPGEPTTVTVTVTNNTDEPATLAGWIDLGRNGVFGLGAEREFITIPASSGTADYELTFPASANLGLTYARFRVFPGIVANPLPTGPASAGEVEDYRTALPEQPPWVCTLDGILSQGSDPTSMHFIDMITGDTVDGPVFTGRNLNALAYNPADGHLYAWDHIQLPNGDRTGIVRIGNDGSHHVLGMPSHPELDPAFSFPVGDIDASGQYWVSNATGASAMARWFRIDLAPGSPTFMQVLDTGLVAGGDLPAGTWVGSGDWAWVPGGGDNLWRVMVNNANGNWRLWRFDMNTGQHHLAPLLPALNPQGTTTFGAAYADDQFLYVSNNTSGDIFRVDIQAGTASLFTEGPPSGNNDGARCPIPIYTDYGDAPESYGTLLDDNGPRHGLHDYDPGSNTTSLMLGTGVSHETDGQPSAGADADTFDDGVAEPIVLVRDGQTTIQVTVTNNTGEVATLVGWIDLDGSGTFDAGDRSNVVTVPANSGVTTHELTFDPATTPFDTYARFRIFPGAVADPEPLGQASAGEVEDYFVPGLLEPPLQTCTAEEIRASERWWYFGNNAGIDFDVAGTTATPFTHSQVTMEGSTVVTDTSGQLLFWSNGQTVFDRNSNPMPNGSGLLGEPSATQTVAAFPAINQPGTYFVVTTTAQVGAGPNGRLHYSVVDMSLNGGLGDVTTKNMELGLANTASEALSAVPNADGTGFWVLTYTNNSPNFLAYAFDDNGPVTGNAVVSVLPTSNFSGFGSININRDLDRLVALTGLNNGNARVRLLSIDAVSGQVMEQMSWLLPTGAGTGSSGYTADFSPSGDYVYASKIFGDGQLYRYDISDAETGDDVKATEEHVGATGTIGGQVRRGPDGRMYVASARTGNALSVVNAPDDPVDPGFVSGGFPLAAGSSSDFGLPQTVTGCPLPPEPAQITIIKLPTAQDGTIFPFTTTAEAPDDAFELSSDTDLSYTFSVPSGTVSVTEAVVADWVISDISCVDQAGNAIFTYTGAPGDPSDDFERGDDTANITIGGGGQATCTFTNAPTALPTLAKYFNTDPASDPPPAEPPVIPRGGTVLLTFVINNTQPTSEDQTGLGFTDTLPPGLVLAGGDSPPDALVGTNTCGGTVTAQAGTGVITLAGGTLAANAECSFTVRVTTAP